MVVRFVVSGESVAGLTSVTGVVTGGTVVTEVTGVRGDRYDVTRGR